MHSLRRASQPLASFSKQPKHLCYPLTGVERTWKGWAEGEGLLKFFYSKHEAQQEIASLRRSLSEPPQASRPYQNPPYEYELQHIPSLPSEIYAITSDKN